MILEEIIRELPNPEFKLTKKKEPQSINPNLPSLFFSCLICGTKNSGKSYAMTSLLKLFEKNPIYDINGEELEQRIILFSPTARNESNIVFKNLKYLKDEDIYEEYNDEILEDILSEIKGHIEEVNRYENYLKILEKFKKTKEKLSMEEYWELYNNNLFQIKKKST